MTENRAFEHSPEQIQEVLDLLEDLMGVRFHFFRGTDSTMDSSWPDRDWILGVKAKDANQKWGLSLGGGGFPHREGYLVYYIILWQHSFHTLGFWSPTHFRTKPTPRFQCLPTTQEVFDFILASMFPDISPLSLLTNVSKRSST